MKIIFVLNHYLPYQIAGTEVYTSLLAAYFRLNNYQVSIIIPNYGSSHNSSYDHNGIHVHCYAEPSDVDRSLIMGLRQPDGLKNFEKLILEIKPDIIHFQELAGSNGITIHHVEAAKKLGFKVVFTLHLVKYSCKTGNLMLNGTGLCDGKIDINRCTKCSYHVKGIGQDKQKLLLPIARYLYRLKLNLSSMNSALGTALSYPFLIEKHHAELMRISNSCEKIVTLTSWYKQILLANGIPATKLELIPQALPQLHQNVNRQNCLASGYPIKLIFIGRISHFKGVHLLIDALKNLPQDNITLDIYGQETENYYVKACKEGSKDMQNIKWGGRLHPENIVEHLQRYHALCLPSTINEMSPLVIQETFAAGIPVIASDVYGNTEQISHNFNGLLFQINCVASLQSQLKRLLDEPSLLPALMNNIKQPDTFDVVGMAYLKLYKELLNT